MYSYDEELLKPLVGKIITQVQFDEDYLIFTTTDGIFSYGVEGDCCSTSYFHDFIGVEKLLKGNTVVSVRSIELDDVDTKDDWDVIQSYGYEIVTDDPTFGEVTSVFSFRNRSNGYYGGNLCHIDAYPTNTPTITQDKFLD